MSTHAEYMRKWRAANKERSRAHSKKHYQNNLEQYKQRAKANLKPTGAIWRKNNLERSNEYYRNYRKEYFKSVENKIKRDSYNHSYREKQKLEPEAKLEAIEYRQILLGDPCSYCGLVSNEVDHITAIKLYGSGHWFNLTAACKSCNCRKRAQSLLHFMVVNIGG